MSGEPDNPPQEPKIGISRHAQRRRRSSDPRNTSNQPLILYFEKLNVIVGGEHVKQRLSLMIDLVYSAIREDRSAYGIKLRKSGQIVFDYERAVGKPVRKVITPFNIDESGDELRHQYFQQPWSFTARKAIDILRAMQSFTSWSDRVLDLYSRVSAGDLTAFKECPADRPRRFYSTYIKPLFGDRAMKAWTELREETVKESITDVIASISESKDEDLVKDAIKEVSEALVSETSELTPPQ